MSILARRDMPDRSRPPNLRAHRIRHRIRWAGMRPQSPKAQASRNWGGCFWVRTRGHQDFRGFDFKPAVIREVRGIIPASPDYKGPDICDPESAKARDLDIRAGKTMDLPASGKYCREVCCWDRRIYLMGLNYAARQLCYGMTTVPETARPPGSF